MLVGYLLSAAPPPRFVGWLTVLYPQGKTPKLTMSLQSMNVALVPDKVNHPNGMQIVYVSDGEGSQLD